MIKYTSINKSANEFEYRGKMLKYLCVAYDRSDTLLMIKIEYHREYYSKLFFYLPIKNIEAGLATYTLNTTW